MGCALTAVAGRFALAVVVASSGALLAGCCTRPFLQAHEHPFAWTGVPPGVAQHGHVETIRREAAARGLVL